jgi:four helix bundle protein
VETTEVTAIKHFTDLRVWHKAHELFVSIYNEVDRLSKTAASAIIVDRILKSAGSISVNIATGFNSRGRKKYIHYLDIAQSSAAETENWLYKVVDCVLLGKSEVQPWLDNSVAIQKMLSVMIRRLEQRANVKPNH